MSESHPLVRRTGEEGKDPHQQGDLTMRFMMIVKANKDSEAGIMPEEKLIAAMTKYNEALAKAGVLLDLSGLQPSAKGARIKFSGGKRTVVNGPFADTAGVLAASRLVPVTTPHPGA